jgi:hypothetical protein
MPPRTIAVLAEMDRFGTYAIWFWDWWAICTAIRRYGKRDRGCPGELHLGHETVGQAAAEFPGAAPEC